MRAINKASLVRSIAELLLLVGILSGSCSYAAVILPPGSLSASSTSNGFLLTFPTLSLQLYNIQLSSNPSLPWLNVQTGILGDGTVKSVAVTNPPSASAGFYRLAIEKPVKLLLPQSMAFAILGHSCGGIKENAYVTGFDPVSGFALGEVYLSTTCSTGGRGSRPATFTAWAAVTWDLAGNAVSSTAISNVAPYDPSFLASDNYDDFIFNINDAAYLAVPTPAAPIGVAAVQSGDQFTVSWTPTGVNPAAVLSSTLTATPADGSASILTATVEGGGTSGAILSLEPQTTYAITVVDSTVGGVGPASAPVIVSTSAATIPPSAPTGVTASWAVQDPSGATDTLVASWEAADPGNSPIDEYQVTITGSEGAGAFTQTVSGTTLTAYFGVDYIPNWSVTVKAHNAFGWGPASSAVSLGGL